MPDKKLTDSEIVKGLECCVKVGYPFGCDDCPYCSINCNEYLDADALDLIKRLQAENERLKGEQPLVITNCEVTEDMLELLKKSKTLNILDDEARIKFVDEKSIKAEAYKEFLSLLEKFRNEVVDKFIIMCDGNDYNKLNLMSMVDTIDCIYDKHIYNLLKERVGD
jgi:hypothetical protein